MVGVIFFSAFFWGAWIGGPSQFFFKIFGQILSQWICRNIQMGLRSTNIFLSKVELNYNINASQLKSAELGLACKWDCTPPPHLLISYGVNLCWGDQSLIIGKGLLEIDIHQSKGSRRRLISSCQFSLPGDILQDLTQKRAKYRKIVCFISHNLLQKRTNCSEIDL